MKILIIGFPRSGTTLIHRIIGSHSEVRKMYFERNMMKRIGTQNERSLNQIFPEGKNLGEKVIYEREIIGKTNSESPTPIKYCKLWNNRFKNEARIIQIIRHPYDVWNSILIKKYIRRDKINAILKMQRKYFEFIPNYFDRISKFKNCFTVKYENLVLEPNIIIPKIYEHCGLNGRYTPIERMRAGRVFAYKIKGFRIYDKRLKKQKNEFMGIMDEKMEECLKVLNQFPGVEYEI